jgi:deoxyhypusine synthase
MGSHVPSSVTEAVLVPSEEVPEGAKQVTGIDFNRHDGRDITAAEMVDAMAGMGFQASAIGGAARIINEMVRTSLKFLRVY